MSSPDTLPPKLESYSSKQLLNFLYELGFYIINLTASDLEWVLKHKERVPEHGKDYITISKESIFNRHNVLVIIEQIERYGFSREDILQKAKDHQNNK